MEFFGKYRGKVENNVDPLMLGRLQVSVPSLLGDGTLSWAMPCVPYAGNGVGLFLTPPVGASVWVEFEGGDPDYPIWAGCFWATGEVPASPAIAETKMLKTDAASLTLSDVSGAGGLTLELSSPAVSQAIKLVADSNGVELTLAQAAVTVTADGIELKLGQSVVTVSSDAIELALSPSSLKVTSDKVEASNSPASASVASSAVELSNGAGKVSVSSSGVAVNDGALDVI